jgi:DNA polymerase I
MPVIDACCRDGNILTWERANGKVTSRSVPWDRSFILDLAGEERHGDLLDGLSSLFRVDECHFRTLGGEREGYRIHAGRDIADAVERQAARDALLYDVDIRAEQQYCAQNGIVPCISPGEHRFSTALPADLGIMTVRARGNPWTSHSTEGITLEVDGARLPSSSDRAMLEELARITSSHDPDIVLFPGSDLLMPRLVSRARALGVDLPFTRTGRYRRLEPRSYASYGRMEYREGSLIPDGRVLIDTNQSFNYREGGLAGVLLASRLTGIPPNLSARLTAGTLISAYEVYEAVRRGISVPYRKTDPERTRSGCMLRESDRGGMIFQPVAGLFGEVAQIDFTSLYPSIIVRYNLSPETITDRGRRGFLPGVLAPLLSFRLKTKREKALDPNTAGMDALLKWMLVTCFGYTGYRNAKFGNIEVHEAINRNAREILLFTKTLAEGGGHVVLHGMVDCLFVQGNDIAGLERTITRETGLPVETDHYDWIVFLPMKDGRGAYNRYYGRLAAGGMKCRGVAGRRHDTPEYVKSMQDACFAVLERCRARYDLESMQDEAFSKYHEAREGLAGADMESLVIRRRVATVSHTRRSPEAAAVAACRREGIEVVPGMEIAYVVTDARHCSVALEWEAVSCDTAYYRGLVDRAWEEVRMAFPSPDMRGSGSFTV